MHCLHLLQPLILLLGLLFHVAGELGDILFDVKVLLPEGVEGLSKSLRLQLPKADLAHWPLGSLREVVEVQSRNRWLLGEMAQVAHLSDRHLRLLISVHLRHNVQGAPRH